MPTRHDSALITTLRRVDAARAEQVGSGFLLRVGSHHFLVSAAHVLIESTLELPTNPRLQLAQAGHILSTSTFEKLDNPEDKYDVGCIHLTADAVARLAALGRTFLELPAIARNFPSIIPIVCVFVGYPASFSTTQVGIKQVVSTPTYIRGEKLSDDRVRTLGHDPRCNFGIAYDREKVAEDETNRRVNGPLADGMSGGPVWFILPGGSPVLIGIGTHYYEKQKALVGSFVAPLIFAAMRRYAGEPVALTVGPAPTVNKSSAGLDGNGQQLRSGRLSGRSSLRAREFPLLGNWPMRKTGGQPDTAFRVCGECGIALLENKRPVHMRSWNFRFTAGASHLHGREDNTYHRASWFRRGGLHPAGQPSLDRMRVQLRQDHTRTRS